MILLLCVGCGYDFTDGQKESGGIGVISSDAAFFCLSRCSYDIPCRKNIIDGFQHAGEQIVLIDSIYEQTTKGLLD